MPKNPTVPLTKDMREKLMSHIAEMDAAPEERKKYEEAKKLLVKALKPEVAALFPPDIRSIVESFDFEHVNEQQSPYILPLDHNYRIDRVTKIPDIEYRDRQKHTLEDVKFEDIGVTIPYCKRFPRQYTAVLVVSKATWELFEKARDLRKAWKNIECQIKKAYSDFVRHARTVDRLEEVWPGSATIAGEPQVAIKTYDPAQIVRDHSKALMEQEAK